MIFIVLVEECLRLVLGVILHVFLKVLCQVALADLGLRAQVDRVGVLWELAQDCLLLIHDLAARVLLNIIVTTTSASRLVRRAPIKPGDKLLRRVESPEVLIRILFLKLTVEIVIGLARKRASRTEQRVGLLIEK